MNNIINDQPIINIGCLGCVSDGKSTLIEKLTGIKTQRHSNEKDRNITIKQGYGNMKIWLDNNDLYYSTDSNTKQYNSNNISTKLVNHISFVDCPGHQDLILTLLSAVSLMDGAIIVIAVDQALYKKTQLIQHIIAAKLYNLKKIIICLNKIDLVSKDIVFKRKQELDNILLKYDIKPHIIIPCCFNKKIGLNYLLTSIMTLFNPNFYVERTNKSPLFRISRTFDINKPGIDFNDISGGILGGTLLEGTVKVGDIIEIKPGYLTKTVNGITYTPLKTEIISIKSENNNLDNIIPGGLIGIGTDLDPFYCKNDLLSGNILGLINQTPNIYTEILFKQNTDIKILNKWIPKLDQLVILQIGTRSCNAKIIEINNNIKFELIKPVCISKNENIIVCTNTKLIEIICNGSII